MIGSIQDKIDYLLNREDEARVERALIKGEMENSSAYLAAKERRDISNLEMKQIVHENLLVKKYNDELSEIRDELKTLKELLDWELLAYHKETNKETVEDGSGRIYRVRFISKIKKTNQKELDLYEREKTE